MSEIVRPEDFYKNMNFERKAHGALLIDGIEIGHTMQCPHCNAHFFSRKGSGHRRAFCIRCGEVTCGKITCDACVPYEKRMDICEKVLGLDVDSVPMYLELHPEIKISVL